MKGKKHVSCVSPQAKFEADGTDVNEETITKFAWDTLNAGKVIPGYGHAVLRKTDPRCAHEGRTTPRRAALATVVVASRRARDRRRRVASHQPAKINVVRRRRRARAAFRRRIGVAVVASVPVATRSSPFVVRSDGLWRVALRRVA